MVSVSRGPAVPLLQKADKTAATFTPQGRPEERDGHIPGQNVGPRRGSGELRQDRSGRLLGNGNDKNNNSNTASAIATRGMSILFNVAKGPKVTTCDADHAKDGRQQEDPEVLKDGENDTAHDHDYGAAEEDIPPTGAVGNERDESAQNHISEQREGHEQADLVVGEAKGRKEDGCGLESVAGRGLARSYAVAMREGNRIPRIRELVP